MDTDNSEDKDWGKVGVGRRESAGKKVEHLQYLQ